MAAGAQTFVDKKEASLAWLHTGQQQLDELMKFPGEDKSDEKLLMTVKMQKDMEVQLNILADLCTESERLLGGEVIPPRPRCGHVTSVTAPSVRSRDQRGCPVAGRWLSWRSFWLGSLLILQVVALVG